MIFHGSHKPTRPTPLLSLSFNFAMPCHLLHPSIFPPTWRPNHAEEAPERDGPIPAGTFIRMQKRRRGDTWYSKIKWTSMRWKSWPSRWSNWTVLSNSSNAMDQHSEVCIPNSFLNGYVCAIADQPVFVVNTSSVFIIIALDRGVTSAGYKTSSDGLSIGLWRILGSLGHEMEGVDYGAFMPKEGLYDIAIYRGFLSNGVMKGGNDKATWINPSAKGG